MNIHERVRTARKYRSFTQQQVAEWLGVQPSAYTKREIGATKSIAADEIVILSEKLQIDARWLLGMVDGSIHEYDLRLQAMYGIKPADFSLVMEELRAYRTMQETEPDDLGKRVTIDTALRDLVQKLIRLPRSLFPRIAAYIDGLADAHDSDQREAGAG